MDKEGNRIVIGWVRMPEKFQGEDWIGMMTLPRVIHVIDNTVYFTVPKYIERKFNKHIEVAEFDIDKPCRIKANLLASGTVDIGGYKIYVSNDRIVADRSNVFVEGNLKNVNFSTPKLDGRYDLDIYVDKGIIEIFINDGRYVITNVVYNMNNSIEYSNLCELEIYQL